jgi:Bacterial Ig domain
VTTGENTPAAVVLTGSDPEHDALTFAIVTPPAHGALTGSAPNVTYTPSAGYSGPDSFMFRVNDGTADSAPATVSITVVAALAVTTTAPNGGEKVFANVPVTIQWIAAGAPTGFDVALSRDGGASFTAIPACTALAGAARQCAWTPTGPATTMARIRVTARDGFGGTAVDASDASFTIATSTPTIAVTSPLVTLGWAVGTTRTISWLHNLGASGYVRIELSRNSGATWQVLTPSVRNATATTGSFAWMVSGPTTANALVRVSWLDGPATASSPRLRIVAPEVVVLSPTSNVSWRVGSRQIIGWGHNLGSAESVRIEVSRDGGASWSTIAASVRASTDVVGGYEWTVTGPATDAARVRVTWTGDSAVQDTSDVNFRIK